MTTDAQTEFACSIYREHLEEAAFLYEQRLVLLEEPDLTWLALASFEKRLEAHLQGLVLGAETALEVVRQHLETRETGSWYAAVRVFCQTARFDDVRIMLGKTDPRDHGMVQVLADALAAEMPDEHPHRWLEKLSPDLERLVPVALKLVGLGRLDAGPSLERLLYEKPPPEPALLAWTTGRATPRAPGMAVFPSTLVELTEHNDPQIRAAAALSLMRTGCGQALEVCREKAGAETWACLPLGLGGGREDVNLLMRAALEHQPADDALTALGLLGHILAVDLLIDFLDQPGPAPGAAKALNLITGAGLHEEFFIADPVDPDELFDDELEKMNQGQSLYPPGNSPGVSARRIVQDKETWRDWWHRNRACFDPGLRYRHGRPFGVDCLLETLQSPSASRQSRQLALEELVIRYGIDIGFETEMFVKRQKKAIASWTGKLRDATDQSGRGLWYFAGTTETNGSQPAGLSR